MNDEFPHEPGMESEARVTALLLGELTGAEAAALRQAIEEDSQMAALHERLRKTVTLVREVAASPTEPAAAQNAPMKLSEERRQKLLAQFKTVKVKEFEAKKPEKKRVTPTVRLLELAAILVIMAMLAGMLLPSLAKAKYKAPSFAIRNNLKQIDLAKQMWAEDNKKSDGDEPTAKDLAPYMGQGGDGVPLSILGEKYVLGRVGEKASAEVDANRAKATLGLRVTNGFFGMHSLNPFKAPEPQQMARLSSDGRWELEGQKPAQELARNYYSTNSVLAHGYGDQKPPISQKGFSAARQQATEAKGPAPTRPEIYLPPQELQPANPHAIALDNAGPTEVHQVLRDNGISDSPSTSRANPVVSNPLQYRQQTILQQQNSFAEAQSPPQAAAETRSGGTVGGSAVPAEGQLSFGGAGGGAGPSVNGKSVTTAGQAEDFRRNAGVGQADPAWVGALNQPAPKQSDHNPFVSNYGYVATNGRLDLNGIQNRSSAVSGDQPTVTYNFGSAEGSVQQYGVNGYHFSTPAPTDPIDPATELPTAPPKVELKAKFADVAQNDNKANLGWSFDSSGTRDRGLKDAAPLAAGVNADSFSTEAPKPSAAPATTPEARTYFKGVGAINNGDVGGIMDLQKELRVEKIDGKTPQLGDVPDTGRLFASEPRLVKRAPGVDQRGGQALMESDAERLAKRRSIASQTRAASPLPGIAVPASGVEAAPTPAPVLAPPVTTVAPNISNESSEVYHLNIVGYVNVPTMPTNSQILSGYADTNAQWNLGGTTRGYYEDGQNKSVRDYAKNTVPSDAAVSVDPNTHNLVVMADDSTYKDTRKKLEGLDRSKAVDDVNLGVIALVTNSANGRFYMDLNRNGAMLEASPEGKSEMKVDLLSQATEPAASQAATDEAVRRQLVQLTHQNKEQELKESQKALEEKTDAPLKKPATPAPEPQPEVLTSTNAFSTFSLNVADVSFKLAAASLEKGVMPEAASIRSEEFINAFDYRDPEAPPGVPIAFAWERARYPFAQNRDLLRFSLKTAATGRAPGRPLNIVLLLDNSGSMERADRVEIIREALHVLAGQLQPQDRLSIVTFARTPRLFVDGVSGDQAGDAVEKVSGLTPQGGTNLEDAMRLAYETARRHYFANGVNRVVLLTDGAANLGNVDPEALKQKVEANRKQGLALDCFGIGWEGYNDDLLEVLARNGDGRYGFLNTPEEAATGFAHQLAGALNVAAADVKVQVEFNPGRVTVYRQIGYAKLQLKKEQFRDNTVDAAEIGAAEAGNALYTLEVNPNGEGPLATVRVRYKVPGTEEFHEHEWAVPYNGGACAMEQSSPAMRLAATASAFSEWLAASPYAAEVTPDALLKQFAGVPEIYGVDGRPQKLEWMLRQAKSLQGK